MKYAFLCFCLIVYSVNSLWQGLDNYSFIPMLFALFGWYFRSYFSVILLGVGYFSQTYWSLDLPILDVIVMLSVSLSLCINSLIMSQLDFQFRLTSFAFLNVMCSLQFFLVTNLFVFLVGRYGYSWASLFECYYQALPFFKNTYLSNLLNGLVLFYGWRILNKCLLSIKTQIKKEWLANLAP